MKLKILITLLLLSFISHSVFSIESPVLGKVKLSDIVVDSLKSEETKLYNQKKYAQLILILYKLQNHYEITNNKLELYKTQLFVADIHRASRNFDKALEITASLLNTVSKDEQQFIADIYRLKSATYYEAGESKKSIIAINKSISSSTKSNYELGLKRSYNILGAIYKNIDLDSSIFFLHKALEFDSGKENTGDNSLICFNLSNAYNDKMEYDSVKKYGLHSFQLATDAGIHIYQTMALNSLINVSKNKKDFVEAIRYIELRDSIQGQNSSESASNEVNQIVNFIENKKKRQELAIVKENLALNQELNRRKNIYLILAFIVLTILSAMSLLIYRANIRNRDNIRRLKTLNKEVSTYSNNLANLNQTKDKILSVISHDLRSPFSQFITLLSFAKEGDISEEDYKQINDELLVTAKSGLHMLDNLLYWAGKQVQGRKVTPVAFNVLEVLGDVKEQLHYLIHVKNIKVKINCEFGLTLFADKVLFGIVVRNILNNAIKFSPEKGIIKIIVISTPTHISTTITDQGVGVPNSVIESFNNGRLDYNSTPGTIGEKGAGMGLYLSREFAEHTGGTLIFKKVDKGTSVEFSVPIT